jgi:hypothetical protein
MEIPYTVTARKDTGLFNSKIGIWLFLASEVMLFGGLFSGYVFLRIYADYPWPERALPVLPGLINTFVLIGSSVTVVFAWASLKMRQWGRFQFFMGITLLCAVAFMVLKGIEYKAKWGHQAVRLDDFTIVEGHLHKASLDENGHMHVIHKGGAGAHGDEGDKGDAQGGDVSKGDDGKEKFYANVVVVETEQVKFTLTRAYQPYVDDLLEQVAKRGGKLVLAADFAGKTDPDDETEVWFKQGDELTPAMLNKGKSLYLKARAHNGEVRTAALKASWRDAKKQDENQGKDGWEYAEKVQQDFDKRLAGDVAAQLVEVPASMTFTAEPKFPLIFKRSLIREGEGVSKLKDDTEIVGKVASSPLGLAVDAIDLRFVAQRAIEQGKDPETVIDGLWIMQKPEYQALWEMHRAKVTALEKELLEDYGVDEFGNAKRVPTETERYRIDWQDMVAFHEARGQGLAADDPKIEELRPGALAGFAGPSHKNEEMAEAFISLDIPN